MCVSCLNWVILSSPFEVGFKVQGYSPGGHRSYHLTIKAQSRAACTGIKHTTDVHTLQLTETTPDFNVVISGALTSSPNNNPLVPKNQHAPTRLCSKSRCLLLYWIRMVRYRWRSHKTSGSSESVGINVKPTGGAGTLFRGFRVLLLFVLGTTESLRPGCYGQ